MSHDLSTNETAEKRDNLMSSARIHRMGPDPAEMGPEGHLG